MKKEPTGFVAICQCGVKIGAMDYTRTERKDAGKILGKWLHSGCIVEPRFLGTWSENIGVCECNNNLNNSLTTAAPDTLCGMSGR